MPDISLILPAYNPGSQLVESLRTLGPFLEDQAGRWEAVFVCDGCTDGSAERLALWRPTVRAPVQVLSYAPNRGKGYAVRHGLAQARGRYRIFTDIDLAYTLDDITRVADALRAGAEAVIASRAHPESTLVLPVALQSYIYRRHLQSRVFGTLTRLILPLRQRDTQAGLKGFSASALARLLPHLQCDGFGFDCELLTGCAHFGIPVKELPVCVRYDTPGSTTAGVTAAGRMLRELWRIRGTWRGVPVPAVAVEYRKAV